MYSKTWSINPNSQDPNFKINFIFNDKPTISISSRLSNLPKKTGQNKVRTAPHRPTPGLPPAKKHLRHDQHLPSPPGTRPSLHPAKSPLPKRSLRDGDPRFLAHSPRCLRSSRKSSWGKLRFFPFLGAFWQKVTIFLENVSDVRVRWGSGGLDRKCGAYPSDSRWVWEAVWWGGKLGVGKGAKVDVGYGERGDVV